MTYLSQVSSLLKVYLAQSPKVTALARLSRKCFSLWGHHSHKGVVQDPTDPSACSASTSSDSILRNASHGIAIVFQKIRGGQVLKGSQMRFLSVLRNLGVLWAVSGSHGTGGELHALWNYSNNYITYWYHFNTKPFSSIKTILWMFNSHQFICINVITLEFSKLLWRAPYDLMSISMWRRQPCVVKLLRQEVLRQMSFWIHLHVSSANQKSNVFNKESLAMTVT